MNDYIRAVQKLLGQLTTAEQQEVVEYYREYLLDAGIGTYEQAVDELGTPRSLARKVLADYSIKLSEQATDQTQPRSTVQATKENVRTVWLIILALLSTPVTIPILIVVLALFMAFAAVIFSLAVAALAVFLSVIMIGAMGIFVGITTIWTTPWTGTFYLGIGLFALGASWIGWLILKWIGSKIAWALSWAAKKIYNRFIPRSRAERGRKQ
ncbi:DUF1700 domain-containing protein [Levilactobacillus cerevisiae]|uniref:DUF1700 domain-containing protein n=1 Tax=Levilactobacillus cerevisiae TaxID=1704076 RepID=UPI000F77D2C2|nr:DUF1700 domain-containing protein [Levilactobacillus cerevisiae]